MSNVQTRWTQEEKQFVLENMHKLTIEQIARHVDKTTMSINLFLHRLRLTAKGSENSILKQMLTNKFGKAEYFAPNKTFYKIVEISQKRWWDLYHGRKAITEKEYIDICKELRITLEEAFEARQLTIFKND